ncbi:hypothetical protein ACFQ4C_20130 [Larkinella insperata]|uniref:Peptidase M48 domain-containing protein n=1 Tax=Larkinella insperata TaxID=332158 RepID=A0ABW3QE80_9BACT|nr:hypothetical protein [Larkinella insperata]
MELPFDAIINEASKKLVNDWANDIVNDYDNKFKINIIYEKEDDLNIRVWYDQEDHVYNIYIPEVSFRWIFYTLAIFLSDNRIFEGSGISYNSLRIEKLHNDTYKEFIESLTQGPVMNFTQKRAELLMFLHEVMVIFIMNHEFGHILCGHLRLIKASEEDNNLIDILTPRNRKTIEIDADTRAISGLAALLQVRFNPSKHFPNDPDRDAVDFRIMAFIFTVFFLVFDRAVTTLEEYEVHAYVTPFMRILICYGVANTSINLPPDKRNSLSPEERDKAYDEVRYKMWPEMEKMIRAILNAIAETSHQQISLHPGELGAKTMNDPKLLWRLGRDAILHWNYLYPFLQPFAYITLRPIIDY